MEDLARPCSGAYLTLPEVQAIETLIRRAGAELMRLWPGSAPASGSRDLGIVDKSDGTPVSKADFASNEILTAGLSNLFPHDIIISEESEYPTEAIGGGARRWIIDPLDGTKSFIAGKDDFSVLVALSVDGRVIAGFMFFPAQSVFLGGSGKLFVANPGIEPKVSAETSPRREHVFFARFDSVPDADLASPHMDSGYAFRKVAQGSLDGAIIRMVSHREWDLAAPAWLIEHAGGRVTDEKGDPLRFGFSAKPCEFCVASNGRVHDHLLKLVQVSRD